MANFGIDMFRYQKGLDLLTAGRPSDAHLEFQRLLDESLPSDEKASVLWQEAECYRLLGRWEEAMKCADRCVELKPHGSEDRLEAEYFRAAVEERQAVQKLERDTRVAAFLKALQRFDCILKDYAELLRRPHLRAPYESIQVHRGILLQQVNKFQEAHDALQEAQSYNLEDGVKGSAWLALGLSLFYLNRKDEAEKWLRKVFEDPGVKNYDQYSSKYVLGIINAQKGAYAKALLEFQACEPHTSEALINRKDLYEWLAFTSRGAGLTNDADKYEQMAHNT